MYEIRSFTVPLAVFRISVIVFYENGSSDPFPDFTDPDPTHLTAIFYKNLLKHHITDNKFS